MEIDRGLPEIDEKNVFSYSSEPTSLSLHLHVKNIFNLSQLFLLMINRFDWNSRESKSISQHYLDIFFSGKVLIKSYNLSFGKYLITCVFRRNLIGSLKMIIANPFLLCFFTWE